MEAPAAGAEEKQGPQIREGLKRLLPRQAPKGVSDFEGFEASLKRRPDTKHESFRSLFSCCPSFAIPRASNVLGFYS